MLSAALLLLSHSHFCSPSHTPTNALSHLRYCICPPPPSTCFLPLLQTTNFMPCLCSQADHLSHWVSLAGRMRHLLLGLALLQELCVCLGYNLATSAEKEFSGQSSGQFGYRVRQFHTTQGERILVGDPGSGQIYACDVDSESCDVIIGANKTDASNLGLTLEVDPSHNKSIVCGPGKPRDCYQTPYTNGECYMIDSSLATSKELNPGHQDCQKAEVDLCFMVDGSSSMGEIEVNIVKEFMKNVIKSLENETSVHFAAIQFSTHPKTEFTFADFQKDRNPDVLLANYRLLKGFTNTYKAIQYTLDHIFTEQNGSRPSAKKVLVILADGESTDDDTTKAIEKADKARVSRYIIGVGQNFKTEDLEAFVSWPAKEHTRTIEKFDAQQLTILFAELQRKILSIEGAGQGTKFKREFSSAGLSSAVLQDMVMLGDPGVYGWSGGLLELELSHKELFINMSQEDGRHFGYLGYSVKFLRAPGRVFCVAGAPRYQYHGQVTLLEKSMSETGWEEIDGVYGEQLGSYFGAEIAVSDLDQDGFSDLVLISAPHYQEERRGGRVYVYIFTNGSLQSSGILLGDVGHPFAQFGAAVSAMGDLDGDGLCEVAVGAPYETEGRGAVYIFKGKNTGIQKAYIQRLVAPPGKRGFGLSIDGVLDMTRDGLIDLAVGSWNNVTLHRSKPLFNVTVKMTFDPPEIPTRHLESTKCESKVTLQACVHLTRLTPQYTNPVSVSLECDLSLEVGRVLSRVSFESQDREVNTTFSLKSEGWQCQNFTLFLTDCSMEDISPVQVLMNVSQIEDGSQWVLSQFSNLKDVSQLPLQVCGGSDVCTPNLVVRFHSVKPLVVQKVDLYSLQLQLQNLGEIALGVSLNITCPPGLSYSKSNVTESSRRTLLSCKESEAQNLICNFSPSSMKYKEWVKIQIMFHIITSVPWPSQIQIEATAMSNNQENETSNSSTTIQVLYPIDIFTKSLDNSTKYVEFTTHDQSINVTHHYQIQNLQLSNVPTKVTISVVTPGQLPHGLRWDVKSVSVGQDIVCDPKTPNWTTSKIFECEVGNLTSIGIRVMGKLNITQPWKVPTTVSVNSSVAVQYNMSVFHSKMGETFHRSQIITLVGLVVLPNQLPYTIGGSIGGVVALIIIIVILYKCGFFKSYKERMQENNADGTDCTEAEGEPQESLTSQTALQD
ncbi:integrin alpha-L isoform X2 [Xenopus tropicalis]|uniref:Integrin alpha-L isoform X2 n=1 Tax=Xenopus tropicalis TaxID=8364 RepID=A0A8J1IY21_XENTR|nr:integrin alpha-L isoform X2 [Xenopus tropicalis]